MAQDISMMVIFTPPATPNDPPTWSFTPSRIDVDPADSAIITIELSLASGSLGTVVFPATGALQWVGETPPANFMGWWYNNPTTIMINDQNTGPAPKGTYGFTVSAVYTDTESISTTFTSPDPTIINLEPTGTTVAALTATAVAA